MSSSGCRLAAAAPLRQLAAAAGRHGSARWFSSDATPAELPSLKSALRAIYKQVHPDLFQEHPPAKDANTRSLKVLHEYLDEAKTGPRVPLPYRFHFFVRGAPGEPMSPTTRKAFGSLLAALGLPPVFGVGSEAEQAAAAAEYNRFVSLREFLPAAVENVHQHSASQASAQQRMGALRTALRLGCHLTVSFGEPAASGGVGAQLPLVQRLVAAVDSLPPNADLAGLTVMIGAANGVDALGTVWLAVDGSEAGWASYLAGVDVTHCRERRRLHAAMKAQEAHAGLLVAPMGVEAEQLYEAVDRLGGPIMSALRRRQQREAELASLRTQVERKVMLRRLLRDPSVSDAHYKSCLERMLGSAQKLSGLLHGQAVRVAQINGLSADRSVIDIAWNWQLG
ncbi:T-cell activation mitochondrial [Chlorella sorokiniana]|uniref:T-cell activation mitochondrial n=1 Tax=Chlorella sorokiniana TaxID=3076 RepID=A0A2P6TK50_CHLSO|nr:T-cell activation mitochondrial [Chlorella sorokiniana]|eukprot:PRW44463.1 T-cell activation mitochondrial [Chlorella sorokiniana]